MLAKNQLTQNVSAYFFFFFLAVRLQGYQFPDQGLNLGHGSESTEF